jgi:hypothetical protein
MGNKGLARASNADFQAHSKTQNPNTTQTQALYVFVQMDWTKEFFLRQVFWASWEQITDMSGLPPILDTQKAAHPELADVYDRLQNYASNK